jgi:aspartate 1-decarboxylase
MCVVREIILAATHDFANPLSKFLFTYHIRGNQSRCISFNGALHRAATTPLD